jgi:hypothetical protein
MSHTAGRLPFAQVQVSAIRVRLRMFRRSTHAAFRARSFCDHWRGEQQRRRETSRAVGPDAAVRREEKALGRQLQHRVREGSWRSRKLNYY